jgi:hypothetical protein
MDNVIYLDVIIIIVCIIALTSVADINHRLPLVYMLCIMSLTIAIFDLVNRHFIIVEHMQISGEAVQNVGSIYNNQKMVVKDLDVTGKLTVTNDKLTIDGDGNINTKGWLFADQAIASNKELRVDGGSVGGKFYAKQDGTLWTLNDGDFVKYDKQLYIKNDATHPMAGDNRYLLGSMKIPGMGSGNQPLLTGDKNLFGVWKFTK